VAQASLSCPCGAIHLPAPYAPYPQIGVCRDNWDAVGAAPCGRPRARKARPYPRRTMIRSSRRGRPLCRPVCPSCGASPAGGRRDRLPLSRGEGRRPEGMGIRPYAMDDNVRVGRGLAPAAGGRVSSPPNRDFTRREKPPPPFGRSPLFKGAFGAGSLWAGAHHDAPFSGMRPCSGAS